MTHNHKIHQQDQRLICISNQGWYLRTREGLKGPFCNQQSAQAFLKNITRTNNSKRQVC
ncbi:MAG: hypothetical protein OEY89_00755 [Gammaproteobacteria bacterium]|nr:hypothetical protein [Gammaproteobacteria bacterium]